MVTGSAYQGTGMKSFLRSPFLIFLLLTLAGLLVYANAIGHPFVHDDVVFIQQNTSIGRWDNIGEAFSRPGVPLQSLKLTTPYYRPVLEIFYRAEYALWGMHPAGFHLFNIVLHVLNAFLVYCLALGWRLKRGWAFAAALLFLVHPLQSEAVACVSGISNLVVAFFFLLGFVGYLKARQAEGRSWGVWTAVALGSFVFALFSKEQAVAFPVCVLLYEFLQGPGQRRGFARWWLPATFFWIVAAYLLLRQVMFPGMMHEAFADQGELWLRIGAIPQTLLGYLKVIFWPVDLHYYRSIDILAPRLVPSLIIVSIVSFGVALCAALPWRFARWAWFGLGWFVLTLAPVLNIVPLINEYSLILSAEHFLYLPLAGALLFLTAATAWGLRTLRDEITVRSRQLLLIGIVLVLSAVTVGQNYFWRGEIPLFERTLRFEPGLGRVHLLLGRAYAQAGRFSDALEEYARGLRIMEDYVKKAGHSRAKDVYLHYVKTTHFYRGQCYRALGDLARSSEEYGVALDVVLEHMASSDIEVKDSVIANDLAINLIRTGDRTRARAFLHQALTSDPHNVEAMNNLGVMDLEEGRKADAVFWFERALKISPVFRPAWDNLKRAESL